MAQFLNIPAYIADPSTGEAVTGYEVQSSAPVAGQSIFSGVWSAVTGSPFASNIAIFDPSGVAATQYRVRPVRQVTVASVVYTLDSPWSRPFTVGTPLYDAYITRALLPMLRFQYLNDAGISQTNSTSLTDTTGSGNGVWAFDGTTKRFQLQYVMNDDPIRVLDGIYTMTYIASGQSTLTTMLPDVDYSIDVRAGSITFKTAPAIGDYARFDFRRTDFVNEDLLLGLTSGVNILSGFGLSGYAMSSQGQLYGLNKAVANPDLNDIICKSAIFAMREGQAESALRSSMAWRDGGASVDQDTGRTLEFLVGKLDVTEKSLRRQINGYIRTVTQPKARGEFEMFWDLTQLAPLTPGMFSQMPYGAYGSISASYGVPMSPWYI